MPCRLRITGTFTLKRSATSCASLNDAGPITTGFVLPTGSGRTTAPPRERPEPDPDPTEAPDAADRLDDGRASPPPSRSCAPATASAPPLPFVVGGWSSPDGVSVRTEPE